jgi:hypothetical protein
LARRYGDSVGIGRLGTWVVWDRISQGRLTDAQALLDDLAESVVGSADALDLEHAGLIIKALRGNDQAITEELELAGRGRDDPNPAQRDWGRWRSARALRVAGRPGEAYEILIGFETDESRDWGFTAAAFSALWSGDLDRIRFLQSEYPFTGRRGRRFAGYRLLLEAGESALTGRSAEAGAAFRRIIDLWDGVMLADEINELRALYAASLPGDPDAQREAETVLRWIHESGATRLLSAWKSGLPAADRSPVPA